METSYQIASPISVLDAIEKRYILTVRDLPAEDRPREKLLKLGPSALSPSELLAIVLGRGTRKEELMAIVDRIIRDYGEVNIFNITDPKRLEEEMQLPPLQAMQIVAVGELGRRFFRKELNGAPVIRTAREAFEYLADMRALKKETLRGLYLNAHYQVIHDEVISVGTVDASIVHPREVFRPAISAGAAAIILAHNHPSGVSTPSDEDVRVTRQIAQAGNLIGIELVDHLIIAGSSYVSIPVK